MAQWNGSESGILRKTITKENHDELLVFGYACKLFRDDEKALYIDKGKHLIPWMGDVKLKIDRYDCRGHLSDISKYEASREGYDAMRWLGLSDKERQLEELCDKERYYSLEINEEEEEMYKEEEHKRQKTAAIAYSYDVPSNPDDKKEEGATVLGAEEVEENYVPPPILDVPVDIDIPKTVKENARIEKTALFVCKQGPQMEILIKAKQGDNPQFSFLNQGDKLNKFYRHVLAAFKRGIYQGYEPIITQSTEKSHATEDQDSNNHYLHPSLLSANLQPEPCSTVTVPQVPYKPSVNCAYSQLVNRIQGNQNEGQEPSQAMADFTQLTYEQQQQYYQYYYAQQYYEYCKQVALYQQDQGGNPGQFVPSADFENLDPTIQSYIQQMAYNQYLQHFQQQPGNNSYAQIVSNVSKELSPYDANVPILPQNLIHEEVVKEEPKETIVNDKPTIVIEKPLLSLAAYGSGSDSDSRYSSDEEDDKEQTFKVPDGEIQAVIDKMAVYVSKNGEQFQDIVKAKCDPRFDFLNDGHEYNTYYREKLKELKGEKPRESIKKDKETKQLKKEKKVIAPVSFSIKKAKEEQQKEIKSALPLEESDEEEVENPQPAPVTSVSSSLVSFLAKYNEMTNVKVHKENSTEIISKESERQKETITEKNEHQDSGDTLDKNGILDGDDPILEMIELTEDIDEKKDAKRAEDKIKDKLAAAAREKLASVTRDKALQLERKKRAAAFLKLKSVETVLQHNENSNLKSKTPETNSIEIIDDSSDEKTPDKIDRERSSSLETDIVHGKSRSPLKNYKSSSISREYHKHRSREKVTERSNSGDTERSRSRESEKKIDKTRRNKEKRRRDDDEIIEIKRRKDDEKKEKKKKSHKRKHSKSKRKKNKKHHRRSSSESSTDTIRS